jgi:hypothetical protein
MHVAAPAACGGRAGAAASAQLACRRASVSRGAAPPLLAAPLRGAGPARAACRRACRVSAGAGVRVGTVKRVTKETSVEVSIDLDGTGVCVAQSGIPFLDHMLDVRGARWSPRAARTRASRRVGLRCR